MNSLPQNTYPESARRIVLSRLESVLSDLLFYVRCPTRDTLNLEWRDGMLDAVNRVFTAAIESESKCGNQAFAGSIRNKHVKAKELVHVLTGNPAVSTLSVQAWASQIDRTLFFSVEELVQQLRTLIGSDISADTAIIAHSENEVSSELFETIRGNETMRGILLALLVRSPQTKERLSRYAFNADSNGAFSRALSALQRENLIVSGGPGRRSKGYLLTEAGKKVAEMLQK